MRTPNIRDARDLCNRLGVRAVMVIALTEDNVSGASYAQTKTECGQTAHTLDKTIEGITDGSIPVWIDRRKELEAVNKRIIREGIEDGCRCGICRELQANCDCSDILPRRVDGDDE